MLWKWLDFRTLFLPYRAIVYELADETHGLDEWHSTQIRLGCATPNFFPQASGSCLLITLGTPLGMK